VLASKFYGLYSLLRDLLSKQLHYDWGLRAVKSVLVVAGGFKRLEPDLLEEALLMRALRDFNIPKIVREDEVVFFGLLGDLFPGIYKYVYIYIYIYVYIFTYIYTYVYM
jgi:dynein heavy chain